jgi:hypothetical protein
MRARVAGSIARSLRLGHFEPFEGLLPPEALKLVGCFMLTLEGIFRFFPPKVQRSDSALLEAIDVVVKPNARP